MRKVAALIMMSLLALSSSAAFAAGPAATDCWYHDSGMMKSGGESYNMFDGINLTEQQRQQMRDLMRQTRHEMPRYNMAEMETMRQLVTADKFDEDAVRAQAEKMAQEQVERQVELAKVRHQIYLLLSPEQRTILAQRHEQNMQNMQQRMSGAQPASTQKMSESK